MDTTTDILQIKIARARENLLQESRNAIDAVNWKLFIQEMNHKFNEDQIDTLTTETELLLCGLVSTEDYPEELEKRMQIPKSAVAQLISDLDKQIFKKIHEEFEKRLNDKGDTKITYTVKPLIIDPKFSNLPNDIQKAVAISDWKGKLYTISKKYNLSVDKMGILEEITVKTINGEIHTSAYENEVLSRINLPADKNKEMVTEINEEIFKVIKGSLVNSSKVKPSGDKEIPLPPYVAKKEETILIPLPSYNKEEVKIEIKKEEKIIENEDDLYKKHGIEIISDVPVAPDQSVLSTEKKEEINYREEIPASTEKIKDETNVNVEKNEYIEVVPEAPTGNIITNKLFGNTTSKTTVSDYSLPKISKQADPFTGVEGSANANPHDPYHEVI